MGRIPDHLVSLAVRALENRWVTIGAKADSKRPGKKKGGTPVELDGEGKITKGPAALTGKRPSELSQSHLFTGQDHKSQRKLFAEPGDPPPPPPIDETPKAPAPAAKKEPKPRAKKPLSMSLLAVIRREGGISSGDFEHADFKEFGLLGALNKKGLSLDDMAATMVRQGHITVPMGKSSPSDHLLQLLKKKTNSLLAADTAEYDKDYEAYMQAREEAQADGYPEEQLAEASGRGEEAGDQESKDRLFDEIFGGDGSGGEEAGRDEEPGDLAGDSAEPAGGVDTSFDFGPAAAPKVEEKPKKAASDKPKGATLQPDGTLKTKDGTVWVRAKAGGEHSPVTDKHYKGGQWMPIHGMSKPKAEKPAEEPVGTQAVEPGEGDKDQAEDKGPRMREPRQPATPEEISQKQKDQEHWDTVKQGPLGRIRGWMGDFPNKRGAMPSINAKSWQKLAEELGPEKVKQIADEMERRRLGRLAKAYDEMTPKEKGDETKEEFLDSWRQIWNKTNDLFGISQQHHKQFPDSYRAVKHLFDEMDNSRTPESLRKLNDYLAGVQNGQADEPAPPPAVEPEPATKQPHEMTAAEYLRNGRPNYGDLVQTADGKVGTIQGGGGIGSTRVKVNGVWHDRSDLKLIRRPHKDAEQNLSDEWKAKQRSDLAKIEKEHGELLHRKQLADTVKGKLARGETTQAQHDAFFANMPGYKLSPEENAKAEQIQAEIDAIKDRPLEFDQSVHSQAVANALAMGKDVPANVLAEYPDLAKKYGKDKAKAEEPAAPPPVANTNLFGTPEPTKPQPATTQGLFGEQVPVEDPKVKPRETVADQAEKGLDWLYQKQDPKTDGTGEMFGGLFSPGRTSGATEPEAGPAVPPAVEPSAPAPKATSLPDRIKNLNVLLNKTRSSANAKALRTAIDQLEREAKGPEEAPAVEPSSTATAPAPQSQSFDDYRRASGVKGYTMDHSMLSPSGRVSGRSANAARARVDKQFSDYNQAEKEYQAKVDAGEIVDPTGKYQKPDQAKANKGEADRLRTRAKMFRSIADKGMQTRKLTKQAEELERQANELDPVAKAEAGPVAAPKVETAKPAPFKFSLDPSGRRGDTAEVNIPFSKRGDLNAQIDRFKKTQKAEQKKQDRLSRELKGPGKPSAKVEQSSGGDETQVRRMIRQNEKDRNRALQTIANLGPNAEAQAYADKLGKENERLKANLPKSAQPGTAPKVEAPETNVIGKGSTGEVVKIGNEVHKNAKGPEGKIYKELSGVDGIAKGRQEGDKIITPHFKNTLSRDDVPRGNRQSFGPVVKKNLSRIVGAVNALSEKGYDYNDPLQIGFDNDRSAHLFDFSNAQKSNTATQDNLSHLGTFLSEFGLPRHGDAVSKIAHLFDYLNNQDTRDFDSDSQESKDATKVLSQLGGQVPKFAYYTFNARAVPNVAQTEKEPGPNGAKLVFSTKPLNKNFMDTWEIMPAIHKDTTTESARIRAFLREAV